MNLREVLHGETHPSWMARMLLFILIVLICSLVTQLLTLYVIK